MLYDNINRHRKATAPRKEARKKDFLEGNSLKGNGGANRDRTDDLLNAIQALSQLSYGPPRQRN